MTKNEGSNCHNFSPKYVDDCSFVAPKKSGAILIMR